MFDSHYNAFEIYVWYTYTHEIFLNTREYICS